MFLPMESHPLPEYQCREIFIELIVKHFLQLHLQPHHPMPPVINRWLDISNLKAFDWYSPYRDRIDNWKERIGSFDGHLDVY
ncbi:PREDICTED: PKS-NRPS hybrid synthetase [Prunus dulcis]|uniref:PREDICTED: PKS-NRPS hybrid synthetase n=1 Tax=Prunus dulcis TaxID=3755 RepID=A0A5E4FWZ5_PRUDU|nr:PREDICTED: PKS-NRPS hybrid synthetase [Prunus dulcis]